MHRLALAVAAALVLHVLFLMIIVPEPQVKLPEIEGSGQVTVSIIRSSPQVEHPEVVTVPDRTDEVEVPEKSAPEAPEQVEQEEPEKTHTEVPEEVPLEPPETTEEIDQVFSKENIQEASPEPIIDQPEERNVTDQNDKDAATDEQRNKQLEQDEVSSFSSNQESLQDPQPIFHRNRPPKYPPLARKRGWEGTVILEVDIRSDGMVKDIQVKQSSKHKILDKEALRAVRKWHFQPGSKAGKFVDMEVLVPVHFTLQDQ